MNKTAFQAKLEYFQMVHGVTLRVISAFGEAVLGKEPPQLYDF